MRHFCTEAAAADAKRRAVGWVCKGCSRRNVFDADRCAVCRTHRDGRPKSPSPTKSLASPSPPPPLIPTSTAQSSATAALRRSEVDESLGVAESSRSFNDTHTTQGAGSGTSPYHEDAPATQPYPSSIGDRSPHVTTVDETESRTSPSRTPSRGPQWGQVVRSSPQSQRSLSQSLSPSGETKAETMKRQRRTQAAAVEERLGERRKNI